MAIKYIFFGDNDRIDIILLKKKRNRIKINLNKGVTWFGGVVRLILNLDKIKLKFYKKSSILSKFNENNSILSIKKLNECKITYRNILKIFFQNELKM